MKVFVTNMMPQNSILYNCIPHMLLFKKKKNNPISNFILAAVGSCEGEMMEDLALEIVTSHVRVHGASHNQD